MNCPHCRAENDDLAETCFKCGKGLFALTEGYVLAGRYEITRVLGRGGMGVVYAAYDRELDERVAIKLLRPEVARSAEMARRFRSEIKLARRVRHRNVCGIHEFGQDAHLQFIAMELIDGVDLKQLLRSSGPLEPETAFDVAIQVAEGLAAIHEVGILHRDLKTPNIMRDTRGAIRLMDFGIAKQVDGNSSVTATGEIVGTPEYMSPEQIRGDKVDVRSDVYALGVILFELFTGDVPLRGETPLNTLWVQINQEPPLTGPRAARLPAAVIPVLAKALAKAQTDRFPSAQAFADAVREARARSLPDSPATPPPWRILTATVPETEAKPLRAAQGTPTSAPLTQTGLGYTRQPGRDATGPTMTKVLGAEGASPRVHSRRPGRWRWIAAGIAGLALVVGGLRMTLSNETVPAPILESPAAPLPKAVESVAPPVSAPEQNDAARIASGPVAQSKESAQKNPAPATVASGPPTVREKRMAAPVPRAPPSLTPGSTPSANPRLDTDTMAAQANHQQQTGELRLLIVPWAVVELDGTAIGTTPLRPLSLSPGVHVVRLLHPDYKPLQRRVTVRAGESARLEVNLTQEAFPK